MKKLLILAAALSCALATAQAQTTAAVVPHLIFNNNSGAPCAGCSLSTFAAGTTTTEPTFTDSTGMSQNTNPIILGADGGANIFVGTNSYKFVLIDTLGNTIFTVDNVNSNSIAACGVAGAVAANGSGAGFACDPSITINTTNHTLNIGSLPSAHVSIGALGTPTLWSLDTTSPATAITSMQAAGIFVAPIAGTDIGSQINTAFASCAAPTKSCKVSLAPGQIYSFSTRIMIPGDATAINSVMQLDCQGSTLTWTGAGDAIQVLSENVNNPSGYIANCTIMNGSGNTLSTNAIHQFSRDAFEYRTIAIQGFSNATSSGIFLDNVAESWGGFNERTVFDHVTTSLTTKGIRLLGSDGGTNSFARVVMRGVYCNAGDGQICLSVEGNGGFQSADAYNGFFDIRGNLAGSATGAGAARAISVTAGAQIRTGVFNIGFEGPTTTNLYYIDSSNSGISGVGAVDGNSAGNFNGGTSDSFNVPQFYVGGTTIQSLPFQNTDAQALNAKLMLGGNQLRYGVPNPGFNAAYFQLYKRVTTDPSDPEVDAEPSTGNTQVNLSYCNFDGCGFGAGYGPTATRGGTLNPNHDLAFNGTFGNQAGTSGTDADGTTYAVGTNYNVHSSGSIINAAGFGWNWLHNMSTTPSLDTLVLNLITPGSSFSLQSIILDAAGGIKIPAIKSTTGQRFVCVDTTGKLVSSASACVGT